MSTLRCRLYAPHCAACVLLLLLAADSHGGLNAQTQTAQYTVTDMGQFYPSAINSAGSVVGWSGSSFEGTHAYLWSQGVLTDLGTSLGTPGGLGAFPLESTIPDKSLEACATLDSMTPSFSLTAPVTILESRATDTIFRNRISIILARSPCT